MDSSNTYNQLQSILQEYNAMPSVSQGDIYSELINRVQGFQPQYQELRGAEAQAYATPTSSMQQFYDTYGADNLSGPSALTQLNNILQDVGRQYGTTNVMRDVIGAQRGRLEDLANTAYQTQQQKQQALMNRYNMLVPVWQTQLESERAIAQSNAEAADRAARLQALNNLYGNQTAYETIDTTPYEMGARGGIQALKEGALAKPQNLGQNLKRAAARFYNTPLAQPGKSALQSIGNIGLSAYKNPTIKSQADFLYNLPGQTSKLFGY